MKLFSYFKPPFSMTRPHGGWALPLFMILLFVLDSVHSATTAPSRTPTCKPTTSPSTQRSDIQSIYWLAGTGFSGRSTNWGGPATSALVDTPRMVFQDTTGVVYVTESPSSTVRKITTAGIILVYAGIPTGTTSLFSGDGGQASSACFYYTGSTIIMTTGVGYVVDYGNNRIRTVSTSGIITTFAGTGSNVDSGDGGKATSGGINIGMGMWINSAGVIYQCTLSNTLRSISTAGILSTIAGTSGSSGYSGDGGKATSALFNFLYQITGDSAGLLYLDDASNNRIRTLTVSTSIIGALAGSGGTTYNGENVAATSANLVSPNEITVDGDNGDVYITPGANHRIMVLTRTSSLVSTIVGTGTAGSTGDGGAASSATVSGPHGVFLNTDNKLYVCDFGGNKVRVVYYSAPTLAPTAVPSRTPTMKPTTTPSTQRSDIQSIYWLAGTGFSGRSTNWGGPATSALVDTPRMVFQDTTGVVYVTESPSSTVRKITTAGIILVYAGIPTGSASLFSGDGGQASSACFYATGSTYIMTTGVGYVVDYGNNRIRTVSTSGIITTFAGTGSNVNSGDGGKATSGGINIGMGMWVSSTGIVYQCTLSHTLRSISTAGILSTIAGTSGSSGYSGDGGKATSALFNFLYQITGDSAGLLYLDDASNNRIRTLTVSTSIVGALAGSGDTVYNGENVAATSANLISPNEITVDGDNGDVYITPGANHRIVVLTRASSLVSTIVGTGTAGSDGDGGAASSATVNNPHGVFLNTDNKLYVCDLGGNKVRVVYYVAPTNAPTLVPTRTPTVVPTLVPTCAPTLVPTGGPSSARSTWNSIFLVSGTGTAATTGTGGPATAAGMNYPRGVWQDTTGVLYVAETPSACVRQISLANIITAYAGVCQTSAGLFSGDGGPATSAYFDSLTMVQVMTTGVSYLMDMDNARVRSVSAGGIVSTYAGTGALSDSGNGGKATSGGIYASYGLWMNSVGVMYIVSQGDVVRSVSASGILSTVAGTGVAGYSGDGGKATSAKFDTLYQLTGDSTGVVYLVDSYNYRMRKLSTSGIVTLLAGTGANAYNGENVRATSASLTSPNEIFVDAGNADLYMSTGGCSRVQVLTATTGLVSTFAGTGAEEYSGEGGSATSAGLNHPFGVFQNTNGYVYIADRSNQRIRVVYEVIPPSPSPTVLPTLAPSAVPSIKPTPAPTIVPTLSPTMVPTPGPSKVRSTSNTVTTVAGTGNVPTGASGSLAVSTDVQSPRSIAQDTTGAVYWTEGFGNCIRKYGSNNIVVNVAGVCGTPFGSYGGDNGKATSAIFWYSVALHIDSVSSVYLTDYLNYRVRYFTQPANIIVTIAGNGINSYSGDGGPATSATFAGPHAMWVNSVNVIYIATYSPCTIRYFTIGGAVTLLAGTNVADYGGDGGKATSASFNGLERIVADTTGTMYVADSVNHRLRVISASSIVTTFAGWGSTSYNGEGLRASAATLWYPTGIAIDPGNADVYVTSRAGHRIMVVTGTNGLLTTFAGTGVGSETDGVAATATFNEPDGLFLDTLSSLYSADWMGNKVRKIYSISPTAAPSVVPSIKPTVVPTILPTAAPTTRVPTFTPTQEPTLSRGPTTAPSRAPSAGPTKARSTMNSVSLVVGTGTAASTGTGGLATAADINRARGVYLDAAEVLYWTEGNGDCVRKASLSDNIVAVFAGTCGSGGATGNDGPASSALVDSPVGILGDTQGRIFISDSANGQVRVVTSGIIASYSGTGTGTPSNTGDGTKATSAQMFLPQGSWLSSLGVLYVSCLGQTSAGFGFVVRSISTSGIIQSVAGTGSPGYTGDGGQATSATLNTQRVFGLSTGVVYISDVTSMVVRQVSTSGIISTYAGTGTNSFTGDGGPPTSATFQTPAGMAVDTSNWDFYIAERSSYRVRVVTKASGIISTFAGSGLTTYAGSSDGATAVAMRPEDLLFDDSGNLYQSEYAFNVIRVIQSTAPTMSPTRTPTVVPTTYAPTVVPTLSPTAKPSTTAPSVVPSLAPTQPPTVSPTLAPTAAPTVAPSDRPTDVPTTAPTAAPTMTPSDLPTEVPTTVPTMAPSALSVAALAEFLASPSFKVTNANAFAALNSDGTVLTWGASAMGGDSSSVAGLLVDVAEVVQSKNAFAARTNGGSVVAWGSSTEITGSSAYQSYSTIESLVATEQAFAGVTSSGGVIAFGASCCGGNVDQYGWAQYLTSGVESVTASAGAFCALKSDGSVYCWGSEFSGGGGSSSAMGLGHVVSLSATRSAFAAILLDGSVASWGSKYAGGDSSSADGDLVSTKGIVGSRLAFAALTDSALVTAWGNSEFGGDVSDVSDSLSSGVRSVAYTSEAFAALKYDGSVVTWGSSSAGGDSSSVSSQLVGVVSVDGNLKAFAAALQMGGVVAWGDTAFGSVLHANVSDTITSVASLHHTNRAFAALQTDKSVVTWGASSFGGDSSSVASYLASGVRLVCANENAFTAILEDGRAVAWGHPQSVSAGVLDGSFTLVQSCT